MKRLFRLFQPTTAETKEHRQNAGSKAAGTGKNFSVSPFLSRLFRLLVILFAQNYSNFPLSRINLELIFPDQFKERQESKIKQLIKVL